MIDREHLEAASLDALGLLDDAEAFAFRRECRVNAELRDAVREARDLVATVAATAPPQIPAPHNLDAILARLRSGKSTTRLIATGTAAHQAILSARWIPWAAAAAFAVLASWFAWQSHCATVAAREHSEAIARGQTSDRARSVGTTAADPGTPDGITGNPTPGSSARPHAGHLPSRFFTNHQTETEIRLEQNAGRLRDELEKLRAVEAARQQVPAGVADLRLIEMRPPGSTRPAEKRDLLPTKVADAIAAGINTQPAEGTPKATANSEKSPDSLRLSGDSANPSSDIRIQSGMIPIGSLNRHPDQQIVHENFPSERDFALYGLTRIDADTVWDGYGGLWHRAADGRTWIGQKAPPDFQPPDPGEPPPPAPPLRPAPAAPTDQPPASRQGGDALGAAQGQPYALPILDQNGMGTLIVQNLPPAPANQAYYLWLTGPGSSEPIAVGVLPPSESPNNLFEFNLGVPGFVPTGYLLTLENAQAAARPGRNVILQGP